MNSQDELGRIFRRPDDRAPSGLLAWSIRVLGEWPEYALRLRSVIGSALSIAEQQSFEQDEIDVGILPQWFLQVTEGDINSASLPIVCRLGRQRYLDLIEDRPWTIREWIYNFDPDLRHWKWWDLTVDQDDRLILWLDSSGEPTFAADELRWAVFCAGAAEVTSLGLLSSSIWSEQPSLGTD